MKIKNVWKFKDAVTGICLEAIEGKKLDRLHLEGNFGGTNNRDFFFTKDGEFDGTGSALTEKVERRR